jgi:calcineurin-like phosphoesterase family protein
MVPARTARLGCRLAASALALAALCAPRTADAQSPRLEAAYVVLGPQGAVARAVLAQANECPAISIDGAQQPMSVRALPDAAFPVLVCERMIPAGARSASLENSPLPVPRPALKAIAAFGDTGCHLKSAKTTAKEGDTDDDDARGKFQDCNNPALWPFAQVAQSVADAKPDLVIHVGDYLYRESACPAGDAGCARSPYGDDWPTWKADFFAPAAPALRAAPWIVVRGNHESCRRAGPGYFRLLDPTPARTTPAQSPPPCVDLIPQFTVTLGEQSFIVLDSSNAADVCPCDPAPYAAQFAAMKPKSGTWLLTHRPVWGFGPRRRILNATLQEALANWSGNLPEGMALALAGHIHVVEVLSFADKRSPQFVLGTGGTLLAGKIKTNLTGETIAGRRVAYGRSDHRFGFAMLEPAAGGNGWAATFRDTSSAKLFACKIAAGQIACD